MEGGSILLDSEVGAGRGNKAQRRKMEKGDLVGGTRKKMLADITNLQQQHLSPSNQQARKQSASLAADNGTNELLKENEKLMTLLANKNAVIESCKTELLKLQSNFRKLRKQNSELAQANNQMLAELNSRRERLRELQHELGCKNGILKAMKLESMEKEHTARLKYQIAENEVGTSQSEQSGQTFQVDKRGDNLCNPKRRRMSKSQSSAPAVTKQFNSTEKVENQRYCLRRQSVGFKAEKPGPTEDIYEADDINSCVSHLQENLANIKGLASSGATVEEETREDTGSAEPTTIEQVQAKESIDKRRQSLRRQSARFKPEDPEATEDFFEIDENNSLKFDPQEVRRSSVGRPLRRAAGKVQSYKEVPLNVKMRRPQ